LITQNILSVENDVERWLCFNSHNYFVNLIVIIKNVKRTSSICP